MYVRPTDKSPVRLGLDLFGQRLVLLLGDVWRIAHQHIDGSGKLSPQRLDDIPAQHLHVEAQSNSVASGELDGLGGDVGGKNASSRAVALYGQADSAGTGAHVHHERGVDGSDDVEHHLHQTLGLGPGHEDTGPDLKRQVEVVLNVRYWRGIPWQRWQRA